MSDIGLDEEAVAEAPQIGQPVAEALQVAAEPTSDPGDPFAKFKSAREPEENASAATAPAAASEVPADDPFAKFKPAGDAPEPTAGEKALAVVQGASGQALETGPMLGGVILGAKLASPTLNPFAIAAGGALGGAGGFIAGNILREQAARIPLPSGKGTLVTEKIENMQPALRPYGFAGEVIGGTLPVAAAPFALIGSKLPPSKIGSFVNAIIETAARSPKAFIAAEAVPAVASSIGAGVAESHLPGNTPARIGVEIGAGLLNPTRIAAGVMGSALDGAKRAVQSMTPAARETRAGKVLIDAVTEAGEDPDTLAEILRQSGLPGVELTAAQKSGSSVLTALEAGLRRKNAKFGAETAQMADDALDALKNMTAVLRGTGDPQALAVAGEMRDRYFRTLLAGRVDTAKQAALEAAAKIADDTPAARAALGKQAREVMSGALEEARKAEGELWGKIPGDTQAGATNVLEAVNDLRNRMLPEEKLPAIVEGFAQRMTDSRVNELPTTAKELLLLRSRALTLAREATANNKFGEASQLGQIAEAALEDLSSLPLGNTVDDARAFSRELHNTFTRTFAGEAAARGRTGADRIPPELLMRRAMSGGADATALRMQEMADASKFMETHGLNSPEMERGVSTMMDVQSRMLRLAAAESINPETGLVTSRKLVKFMKDNEAMLNRFGEVKDILQTALKSQDNMQRMQEMANGAIRAVEQRAAFSRIAKVENPVDAVTSAINGRNPVADLLGFTKLAKRGGAAAQEGLKGAVWDHVFRKAGDNFSFDKLSKSLLDPVRPGAPSVADLMQRAGIMTKKDIDQAKTLIEAGQRITASLSNKNAKDFELGTADALSDLALRIVGARIGAAGAAGASGSSLVAAGAGSKFLRNVFDRVPAGRVGAILAEAMKDPELAAMLLQKTPKQADKIRVARQIHAYMLQAGLTAESDEFE